MGTVAPEEQTEEVPSESKPIINDVVIKIATANGSGSQSANLILLRSIFKMGIPVNGKNLFPSNIAGLPTWYTIRANEEGWIGNKSKIDIAVCMNPQTVDDDIAELETGAVLILNEALKSHATREDIKTIVVPFDTLVKEASADTRLRKKVINVIYDGVLAWLMDVPLDTIHEAIHHQFGGKPAAVNINQDASTVGYKWAEDTLDSKLQHRLEERSLTENKIIIEGNEATALGLMFGGVTVAAWYPITPSSSVCENLSLFMDKYRRDPESDKATYAIVQAEDEIASIGMVLGAGWAGARACTATSGPGISLMAEMAGLSYFAEIPAVIVDVQRMGPSTGLPTRTAQGDILSAYTLSHGDTKHVLLIPGSVEECFHFAKKSLELAEQLQTMVFLMTDLDMGMNKWLSDPFTSPDDVPLSRGKVLSKEDLEKMEHFGRYEDVDGDGIPYRTLPGTDHPDGAFFTRGTGHNSKAIYSEKSEDWVANIDRLSAKYETIRTLVPSPVIDAPGSKIGILAYGSSDPAVEEARNALSAQHDTNTDYLRLRALPLTHDVHSFIQDHDVIYVVEQNRDAQVATIIKSEIPEFGTRIQSILHYDGMPIDAQTIVTQFTAQEAARLG
jgi:2-oxoglutarate ferredoxin oxidoreductase subunit alpha